MPNMKFRQVSDKLTQARINDCTVRVKDIEKVFNLALDSTDVNKCLWNLRVLGGVLDEMKEDIDGMINFIKQ